MPDSIAEALADDPHGLLDEDAPSVPDPNDKDVWVGMLRSLSSAAWNEAMAASREVNGDDWSLDLSDTRFYEGQFDYRDFKGVNFKGAHLEHCNFDYADLTGAVFDATSYVFAARFRRATLTGANLRVAGGIEHTYHLSSAIGYVAPLVDVTKEVAHHFLMEAIKDETSFIHEGLEELRGDGFRLFWVEDKLKFYLSCEMERYRDLCKEGHCACPVDHACIGECSCCSCYDGSCDCEPDHDYTENDPTGEWYLATIVGHIEFQWNSSIGYIGNIVMDRHSQHPHVSVSGHICWGDMEMPRSIKPIEYFVAMLGWVGQHNPTDPYREITTDLPRIR